VSSATVAAERTAVGTVRILSPRLRFAFKTALAITIAYMVPLAMGWNQPFQGAVAIMVIAAAGPLHESLGKGVMRILGTLAGAATGLGLLALFPQEPLYYFLALSVITASLVYLYYAYRGDGTFLLVTLMVMVMLFDNGPLDDRFLYALDRSWTTAFGIFVYAMVNIYLWPERATEGAGEKIAKLTRHWRQLFAGTVGAETPAEVLRLEREWEQALRHGQTEYPGGIAMDRRRWETLRPFVRKIDRIFARMALLGSASRRDMLRRFFPRSVSLEREVDVMLERLEAWWRAPARLRIPPESSDAVTEYPPEWASLSLTQRAELQSVFGELRQLHRVLRELLIRLDRIAAPGPDLGEWIPADGGGAFVRNDPELWRMTLRSMLVFWSGLGLWYFLNPPMAYMIAGLGLVLSLVAYGLHINPLALIAIYSLSFLFAFIAYVGILPQLYGGWALGGYIFGYMFLTYWLIPVPLALFFALGLNFQYILNDRFFSFELFISMLTLFYLFLGLILFFYYLPTSNRAENAFFRAWRDWTRGRKRSLCGGGRAGWASLERMKLHAAKIDRRYFDRVDFEALERYLREAERLTALTELLRDVRRRLSPEQRKQIEKEECRIWRHSGEEEQMEQGILRGFSDNRSGFGEALPLAEYFTIGRQILQSDRELGALERAIDLPALKRSRF